MAALLASIHVVSRPSDVYTRSPLDNNPCHEFTSQATFFVRYTRRNHFLVSQLHGTMQQWPLQAAKPAQYNTSCTQWQITLLFEKNTTHRYSFNMHQQRPVYEKHGVNASFHRSPSNQISNSRGTYCKQGNHGQFTFSNDGDRVPTYLLPTAPGQNSKQEVPFVFLVRV